MCYVKFFAHVIGIAATGSGKTLAFLMPAFVDMFNKRHDAARDGPGLLVMSPTRELAQQIDDEANRFGKLIGLRSVSMYGGAPKRDQLSAYRYGAHVIVACPGGLADLKRSVERALPYPPTPIYGRCEHRI